MADRIDSALHRVAVISDTDPGSIGENRGWLDTSVTPHVLKIRNDDDSAWLAVGDPSPWVVIDAVGPVTVTPVGGVNSWYRCDTTAGDVTVNGADAPVAGDVIRVQNVAGANSATGPGGLYVSPQVSGDTIYDPVSGNYLPAAIGAYIGAGAFSIVQLNADAQLPPVDGSQLTGLPGVGGPFNAFTNAYTAGPGFPKQLDTPYTNGPNRRLVCVTAQCTVPAGSTDGTAAISGATTIAGITPASYAAVGLTDVTTPAGTGVDVTVMLVMPVDPLAPYQVNSIAAAGGSVAVDQFCEIDF
jgi:hypothetical protein